MAILLIVFGTLYFGGGHGKAITDTFTTSGTWTVPTNVSSATFEAWGGGGAGAGSSSNGTGGGGGAGGQYSIKSAVTTNPGDNYTVTVATTVAGSTGAGATGNDSEVADPSSSVFVRAKGGAGGTVGGAGGTGSTTNGIGDSINRGGSGGAGSGASAVAGGGGGGAGSTGNGGDGSGQTAGTGTSTNGGNGGSGGSGNYTGVAGSNYGGGGSGGSKSNAQAKSGGGGAQGLVTVTYTTNSAPGAPNLFTPGYGNTVLSTTPSLTINATDPDNDNLMFEILIHNSNSVSGNNCTGTLYIDANQSTSQTGWSGQDQDGGTTYASGTTATYTIQPANVLTPGQIYCWQARAIDPAGTNSFGSLANFYLFTVDDLPAVPTLTAPASGASGVSITPTFSLSDTDSDNDDIQLKINLFQSDCSTSVAIYDMANGQTGWSPTFNGSAGLGLTYNAATAGAGVSFVPGSSLSGSTTYCWSAAAIDPGGSNTSSYSSTQSFTTLNSQSTNIHGNVNIHGNTIIH